MGASGAIFGVELAYARYWPRDKVFIGRAPDRGAWLVVGSIVLSLFGLGGAQPGIAHWAHLGGLAGAAIYLYIIEHARGAHGEIRAGTRAGASAARAARRRHAPLVHDPRGELHEINRQEVDRLLDKISLKGIDSLTPSERAALDRFSKQKS